jgi:hypothetical protein
VGSPFLFRQARTDIGVQGPDEKYGTAEKVGNNLPHTVGVAAVIRPAPVTKRCRATGDVARHRPVVSSSSLHTQNAKSSAAPICLKD